MSRSPLDPDGATFKASLALVARKLAAAIDRLDGEHVSDSNGAARLSRSLQEPLPEEGQPLGRLVAQLVDRMAPKGLGTASPGYLGYIPGGGLPDSAIADLIGGVLNRYTGLWVGSPGLVGAEVSALRWLCGLVGYGEGAGGLLTSGGSMANLGAVVAAREARLGSAAGGGVILVSELVHHSVAKAARVAGFGAEQLRVLPCDADHRLPVEAAARALEEERAAGREVVMLVASAGTTALGSVDPLAELGALCGRESVWLHVDAAYGGCFLLTERGQVALAGISAADSVTLDPHKGFFLPYGTGALLVKDRGTLVRAFRTESAYLPDDPPHADHWDFADMGPELTRPSRGLRLWLPIKLHGARAFREALDEKLDLARRAAEVVAEMPGVEMVSPPTLSLFSFIVRGAAGEVDARSAAVMSHVNQKGRVFLTGARVRLPEGERLVIRVCVLSFRTRWERIEMLLEDLAEAIEATGAQSTPK